MLDKSLVFCLDRIGHGALGIGHWALGIGYWVLGIRKFFLFSKLP